MELPFEASLLIPFLVAWRAAPTSGDEGVRLAAVASTMKKYDREFDEAKAKAAAAALALRLDELDRDIDEGVRSLCPEDAACVSCGLKGTFTSSSRPTVMHLLDKPIDVKVVTTVCSACGCIHRFNECSAFEACVVLLHHKPSVVKSLQARFELHLQIPVKIVKQHAAAAPSILLVRGFDSPPISILMTQDLINCVELPPPPPSGAAPPSAPPSPGGSDDEDSDDEDDDTPPLDPPGSDDEVDDADSEQGESKERVAGSQLEEMVDEGEAILAQMEVLSLRDPVPEGEGLKRVQVRKRAGVRLLF